MNKENILTDMILESMREEVEQFVKRQGKITSSTKYEDEVLELSRKFAVGLIKHSGNKIPKDRNAKKKS
jgi:hypothetical protein